MNFADKTAHRIVALMANGQARSTGEIVALVSTTATASQAHGAIGALAKRGLLVQRWINPHAFAARENEITTLHEKLKHANDAFETMRDAFHKQKDAHHATLTKTSTERVLLEDRCTQAGREARAHREENDRLTRRCSRLETAFVIASVLAVIELIALAAA